MTIPHSERARQIAEDATTMTAIEDKARTLIELADRVEALSGACRETDALIAEHAYGWSPIMSPPDYDGKNASEILTPDGLPFHQPNGRPWVYPPKGAIHRAYHCEAYTRDATDAIIPRDYVRKQTAASLRALASQVEG